MNNQVQRIEAHETLPQVVSDSATIMAVISRAAADPSCDIEKMERLMAMHERMQAQQAETQFNLAMSAAQAEMRPITADATNGQTKSSYATYAKLDSCLRPIFTKHGFSLSFNTGPAPEGCIGIHCYVSHSQGHTRTYSIDMPADGKGAKGGDVMTKTHAVGSGTAYGMRYLLKMVFNVAIGEFDDDGNAAGNAANLSSAVLDDLLARVSDANDTEHLQGVWVSGLAIMRAARDTIGCDKLRIAVTARKAELQGVAQ